MPMRMCSIRRPSLRRQQGAVLVTVALSLLFLLGIMGLALDFGRLFVVRTEMQTAMDSCALAAASELNGQPDALARARQAGLTVGNLNRVHFQSQSAGLEAGDIQFSDQLNGSYSANPLGNVSFVRCQHRLTGLAPLLLQALDAFGATGAGGAQSVGASAVAALLPSQTSCALPVGVCQKPPGSKFERGEWVKGVTNDNGDMDVSGQFRWLDFDGSGGGTNQIATLLAGEGKCDLTGPGTPVFLPKPGQSNGATDAWNTRFGIYAGSFQGAPNVMRHPPDTTGYAWYVAGDTVNDTMKKRYDQAFAGMQSRHAVYQGTPGDLNNKNLNVPKSNPDLSSQDLARGVANRRVVTIAEINCDGQAIKVQRFACMLMLHPLERGGGHQATASGPSKQSRMWLEYISDAASSSDNPCVSAGLPGTGGGRRVPGLVQ